MDGWECYLVERVNERTTLEPCDDTDCVEREHARYQFDARRADTGEILAGGIDYMSAAPLTPGAMYWQDFESAEADYRPAGPADWGDRTAEQLRTLRAMVQEHPDSYADVGVDEGTGLPLRRPTHLLRSGPHLIVVTPGGPWNVSSRASNCGLPWDYDHDCWIAHGAVPRITVDKAGRTCSAGAGSIQIGDFHGFLQDGRLHP